MSIDDRNLGEYEAYFTDEHVISLSPDYSVHLAEYPGWAAKVMTLSRFKQIRATYHPEKDSLSIGDKCHQLRYALNQFNATS